jgi:hypothetical protein
MTKARPATGADLDSRDVHPISSCEVRDGRRAMTSPLTITRPPNRRTAAIRRRR